MLHLFIGGGLLGLGLFLFGFALGCWFAKPEFVIPNGDCYQPEDSTQIWDFNLGADFYTEYPGGEEDGRL